MGSVRNATSQEMAPDAFVVGVMTMEVEGRTARSSSR